MEYDFLKAIAETIKTLKAFPLPAIIVDKDFNAHWSNNLAKSFFTNFTEKNGIISALSEFDVDNIWLEIETKGNCTIKDIIPLSAVRMSISPIVNEGKIVGAAIILIGADSMLGMRNFYQSTKTAGALSDGIRGAISDMFDVMDTASVKADLMEVGWMKPSFERLSILAYRILRISSNITEFREYQTGYMDMNFENIDIFAFLRDIQDVIGGFAESAGARVEFFIPNNIAIVKIDIQKWESIFFNIIHNALYFANQGNVITIRAVKKKNSCVQIIIEDKGIGIPQDVIPDIFLPYYTYQKDFQSQTLGLGLTLSKILIEAQGGSIDVVSKLNKGTKVTLELVNSDYSQSLSFAQGVDKNLLHDRFSSMYTGLIDSMLGPELKNPNGKDGGKA